jgi:hypothetical protein
MDTKSKVEHLKQYALDHYEEGGHWVYETYSDNDYVEVLNEHSDDLEKALKDIRYHWELLVQRERECAWE